MPFCVLSWTQHAALLRAPCGEIAVPGASSRVKSYALYDRVYLVEVCTSRVYVMQRARAMALYTLRRKRRAHRFRAEYETNLTLTQPTLTSFWLKLPASRASPPVPIDHHARQLHLP